jgi:hypothetical protein
MIELPSVQKQVIRNHYDVSTLFYRLLWGPHIHHGYWEAKESPAQAQIQLTERLARLAEIAPGSHVYDIGCGMGGSSVWLAKQTELTRTVCKGMFCPSLGSQADYVNWFQQAGYHVIKQGLWTRNVEQTWEICQRRVNRSGVRYLANLLGQNHTLFLNHFQAILDAYRTGAMEYGYFIAEKTT